MSSSAPIIGSATVQLPKHPVWEMLAMAAPTVATMTSYTLMQFTDKLIVSRIGPDPIYVAAQGNGGMSAWAPISVAYGVLLIINTYTSQNLGAGRPERAPAYAWNGLWMALMFGVLILPYGYFLPDMFRWLGHVPDLIALETAYGQILVYGASLTIATRALSQFFYGLHRPMVVLAAGVIANIVNVGLVYGLVFGAWGLPRMGIAGSAVGTVIATGIEFLIPMAMFLGPTLNAKYRTRAAWRPSWAYMRDLVRLGWPGGVMFGNEMVCWYYFMVVLVGKFTVSGRPIHSNAAWIAHQWMALSFMPAVGISVAVNALVGRYMGMKRPDLAANRAYLGTGLTFVYMGACALVFVLFPETLLRVFIQKDTSPEDVEHLVRIGVKLMYATAAFQLFDAVAITISGALRGAGDTVVPGVVTVLLAWVVIVGGGNLMVRYAPQLESLGPWLAAAGYIALLCIFLVARFLTGRWRTIDVLSKSADAFSGAGTVDGMVADAVAVK